MHSGGPRGTGGRQSSTRSRLHTMQDAEESLRHFSPVQPDKIIELEPGIKARLRNAGHVLGSCIVELWVEDKGKETKIVFSGDLGNEHQLIVNDPVRKSRTRTIFS